MGDGGSDDSMVPKSRLSQETERLRAAQARVAELEGKVTELEKAAKGLQAKADSHDALVATNQELQGKLKAAETQRTEDLAIIGAGFSDVELFRFEHGRAKDAGSVTDWVEALKKGKVEDAPTNLQPFLQPPADPNGGGDGEKKGDKAGGTTRGSNNGSTATTPGGGGATDDATLAALITKAQETGDWSEYMAARGIRAPGAQDGA